MNLTLEIRCIRNDTFATTYLVGLAADILKNGVVFDSVSDAIRHAESIVSSYGKRLTKRHIAKALGSIQEKHGQSCFYRLIGKTDCRFING
jgi:hypothetical protein